MLQGILPIVFVPFDSSGEIDDVGLRRIVEFELEAGVHGLGINGFASEAYKLTDTERERTVDIVATELAGQVPLIIGIAPGSTEAACKQAKTFRKYQAAALMTLPPATMHNGYEALVKHYIDLSWSIDTAIMVQQSPHIAQYAHCELPAEQLAEMAHRAPNVQYFKLEGPGAPQRMAALHSLIGELDVGLFGGGGGISFADELKAGASGLIPGVGFNELFIKAWQAYEHLNLRKVREILLEHQPLVEAVSGKGHEFSLHARKALMQRAGYLESAYVRCPSVAFSEQDRQDLFAMVDRFMLRVSQKQN